MRREKWCRERYRQKHVIWLHLGVKFVAGNVLYYRGLNEWNHEKGYLTDACLTAQDRYKAYLDYFRIQYEVKRDM